MSGLTMMNDVKFQITLVLSFQCNYARHSYKHDICLAE
jgi:hypothetical protein